jgi:hypothetical protein
MEATLPTETLTIIGLQGVYMPEHKTLQYNKRFLFFLIGILGGGVQLGPLDTAATNRPIVPTPGDYYDGEIGGMIGRGNQSTRRKPAQCRFVHHKPHMMPGREPGPPRWEDSD